MKIKITETMTKRATISKHKELQRILILTAAGSSARMTQGENGITTKKEYISLRDGTVLSTAAAVFLKTLHFDLVVITYPFRNKQKEDKKALEESSEAFYSNLTVPKNTSVLFTAGGCSRQSSVLCALEAADKWMTEHGSFAFFENNNQSLNKDDSSSNTLVFIHDGARPFVTAKIIKDTEKEARTYGAAVPALQPVDTQKEIDGSGTIVRHLVRAQLASVQTPQVFAFKPLLDAHRKASRANKEFTDDTEIWDKYASKNGHVHVISGDTVNKKITYPADLSDEMNTERKRSLSGSRGEKEKSNAINKSEETHTMIHTGLGYDKHALVQGRKLILGGIVIPFDKGEDGHSDGDVLLHAITDALLGASGLGDIGSFFPPSDKKWKDANSCMLLKTVWDKITASGWHLINLDCVVALEQPKFLPYREQVCSRIAEVIGCKKDQVFVKAKTGEKLGDVGKGLAAEAFCTCLLEK
jgi:2-C-methyl-D-erythritol 4-phosphate cytidylyltransferase / 2-C-methyl-D-erythritol 2,4-cyclodiphosphate synthase